MMLPKPSSAQIEATFFSKAVPVDEVDVAITLCYPPARARFGAELLFADVVR
jgi:hypothetical protein